MQLNDYQKKELLSQGGRLMTLLITVFAAIASTIVWYVCDKREELKLGFLSLMFWGASLMWLVDAIFEYIELGAKYFQPKSYAMLNDFFLGVSVVAFGLIIWLIKVLVSDSKRVLKDVANSNEIKRENNHMK